MSGQWKFVDLFNNLGLMKRYYKVAEHIFSLDMPYGEDAKCWSALGNYKPFEIEAPAGEESVILELTLSSASVVDGVVAKAGAEAAVGCAAGSSVSAGSGKDGEETIGSAEKFKVGEAVQWNPVNVLDGGALEPVYTLLGEPDEPRLHIYRMKDGQWQVEMAPITAMPSCASLVMNPESSRATLYLKRRSAGKFAIDNALMLMFAFRTACMNTLEMHSSVVMKDGYAFMNLGKSGAGKSTHSRMWLENIPGCELLNDDNPIVRLDSEGRAIVYGSPWSGKTPCYKNMSAPLGGYVNIIQHPENIIERCSVFEAYASLYSSSSGFKAVESQADGLHSTIEQLALNVPCFNLKCLPNGDAARLCCKTVFDALEK